MSGTKLSKYPAEVFLDFRSVHRFLYRVSDLHELDHGANEEILDRLDDSHVYVLQ